MPSNVDYIRQYQKESIRKRQEELAAAQEEYEAYLESEEYERELWNAKEERWAKSYAKKGLHYEKKPFISALQRKQMQEQAKQEEIAHLEEKLKALKGEQ